MQRFGFVRFDTGQVHLGAVSGWREMGITVVPGVFSGAMVLVSDALSHDLKLALPNLLNGT